MVLALSATPFRTDEEPVPFVHTEGPWSTEINLITEDYIAEYGYGAALTMDPPPVTRAVFERYDADVTWLEADIDGEVEKQATLSGEHAVEVARKARRHAIDARGDWLNRVLISADDKLVSLRADDPRAGGVIICRDTNHVVATANLLLGIGTEDIAVYTQDYATTSHRLGDGRILDNGTRSGHRPSQDVLSAYMDGTAKWILTVRKLSEGVDVPRLRVLVYATVVRTRLFFIQAVGRVVRVRWDLNVGVDQTAWIYIPDDPVTRGYATEIENLVADAEITAYEQDEDENTEGGLPERSSESSEVFDRFVSAEGEYAGMTSGGSAHDPQLAKLAAELGGSVVGNLDVLHKLSRLGLLNLTNDDPPPPDHDPVDPMVVFATKVKQKNQAVKAWASLRLRREDFPSYGDSIRSCNRDLGELFGVWAENRNVSADQVEKATQYAREQIKRLRGRG
jgi:superfamily II DNA or RNA helicase